MNNGRGASISRSASYSVLAIGKNALVLGISLAAAVLLSIWSQDSLSATDEMTEPHVVEGKLHLFFAGRGQPEVSRLEPEGGATRFSVRLVGLVTPVDKNQQSDDALIHHADLLFTGRTMTLNNGTYLDQVTIDYGLEVCLRGNPSNSKSRVSIDLPGPRPDLSEQVLHVGQRLVRVEEIEQLLHWPAREIGGVSAEDTALWAVSELSKKTIRIHSMANGVVLSVQPVDCGLSRNEVDWIRKLGLPGLLRTVDVAPKQGGENVCQLLSGCLPYDLDIALLKHDLSHIAASPEITPDNCSLQWNSQLVALSDLRGFSLLSETVPVDCAVRVVLQMTCRVD